MSEIWRPHYWEQRSVLISPAWPIKDYDMKMNISKIKSLLSTEREVNMISLSDPKGLVAFLVRYGWRVVRLSTQPRGATLHRARLILNFGNMLVTMNKHHGSTFTVKWLKASQLAIQRSIAGNPVKSLRDIEPGLPLPRVSSRGIPMVIRSEDRRLISSRTHAATIRFYLSIFGLYRVIKSPYKLKLDTITGGFSGRWSFVSSFQSWVGFNFPKHYAKGLQRASIAAKEFYQSEKASASNKISWHGYLTDAHLIRNGYLWDPFKRYCEASGSSVLLAKIEEAASALQLLGDEVLKDRLPVKASARSDSYPPLGQLSLKEEAAGKLRVFAIVDGWTQSLLRPLHEALFAWLKRLPNDGTFDQDASFRRCVVKARQARFSAGYDLSAATDRLPMALQVSILESVFGQNLAVAWQELLVSRNYVLRSDDIHVKTSQNLKYAVGQPMGALSSWAMLAVTHHLILQYCATKHNKVRLDSQGKREWFVGYEILGDDIQIFDRDVASEYLAVCSTLGVGINMAKSVVSDDGTVVEYAKRTSLRGVDVSAISWRQIAANDSLLGRVQIAMYLMNKGVGRSASQIIYDSCRRFPWMVTEADRILGLLGAMLALVSQKRLPLDWVLRTLSGDGWASALLKFTGLLPKFNKERVIAVLQAVWRGRFVKLYRERSAADWMAQNEASALRQALVFMNARDFKKLYSKILEDDFLWRMSVAYRNCILLLPSEIRNHLKEVAISRLCGASGAENAKVDPLQLKELLRDLGVQHVLDNPYTNFIGPSPLAFIVKTLSYNQTTVVLEDELDDLEKDWPWENVQVDERNHLALERLQAVDAMVTIAYRDAERRTEIPNEYLLVRRLSIAGKLQKQKLDREGVNPLF